jgi:hypothetical protein
MDYVAIAFRSRSDTVRFSNFLKNNGYESEIVNTPKEAGVGCGLSIKTYPSMIPLMRTAVKMANLKSFVGFFLVKTVGGKRYVKPL